ncbi:hypothetical protein E5843_06680 [Luteimonas yindakuii]|uniref:hypothetical protein n=1 Tax=Luteimonas yindakuii TaxID=2565782 RepID=UPI0010A35D66|nr:hypothetical protein [Luteimonas yindakuii]QCO67534.1 hypothetical protein E5843_06680 [Luteimonas yindakuii]
MGTPPDQCTAPATHRRLGIVVLIGLLVFAAPVLAQQVDDATYAADIAAAEANGRVMYQHARAVAVVPAAMHENRDMRRDRRVAGEITEGRNGQVAVTVIDATPAALYRATVAADGTLVCPGQENGVRFTSRVGFAWTMGRPGVGEARSLGFDIARKSSRP